jgi:hypothetical protein
MPLAVECSPLALLCVAVELAEVGSVTLRCCVRDRPQVLDYRVRNLPDRPLVTLVTCDQVGNPLTIGGRDVKVVLQRCVDRHRTLMEGELASFAPREGNLSTARARLRG